MCVVWLDRGKGHNCIKRVVRLPSKTTEVDEVTLGANIITTNAIKP